MALQGEDKDAEMEYNVHSGIIFLTASIAVILSS